MDHKERPIFQQIIASLKQPRRFINILLGPRQVGKTTLAHQVCQALGEPYHYASADLATLQSIDWLVTQWEIARLKAKENKTALLVLDEAQKISHWSDAVKQLWDEDTKSALNLQVLLLGSSSWIIQKGLTESLAGRFEIIPVTHWSYQEMKSVFNWSLAEYLYFGGYPSAAVIADPNQPQRWINYINDSIIETTISRDILLMTQINKPTLLRRLFQLGCHYSSQIISFQKMLGQLQDAGNTTTLAHYLELLTGAGLLTGLQKYANQTVRQRSSSPKLQVFNTALISAQSGKTFHEAQQDHAFWGHLVESAVGAHLLNSIRGTSIQLLYWREGSYEVDFVLQRGDFITAIEVKSSPLQNNFSGLQEFRKRFQPNKTLIVGEQGILLEDFLMRPASSWMN